MNYLVKLGVLGFALTFFVSGIIISVIQLGLWIFIKPFNIDLFRKFNYYCCYAMFSQLIYLVEWWSGTEIYIYMKKNDYDKYYGKEHAFCISNHTYEIDWIIIPILTEPLKILGNHKCYAKKSLKFVPPLGWVLSLSENVFLERNFEKDKDNIQRQVGIISDYKDPMWLTMYPEGTRFTTAKHKASLKFSTEKNLTQLKYHLQPRTKGFITSIPPMRGKVAALYDFLVAFKTDEPNYYEPSFRNILNGKPSCCHIFIERIPFDSIPENEDGQDKLVKDIYVKKDKMKDSFVKTQDFFEKSGVERIEPIKKEKRIHPLILQIFLFISILCPITYVSLANLLSGDIIVSCITVGFFAIFFIMFNKIIGVSEIK